MKMINYIIKRKNSIEKRKDNKSRSKMLRDSSDKNNFYKRKHKYGQKKSLF